MGNLGIHSTSAELRDAVVNIGPQYVGYGVEIIENGFDGALIRGLSEADLDGLLVASKAPVAHILKLKHEFRAFQKCADNGKDHEPAIG